MFQAKQSNTYNRHYSNLQKEISNNDMQHTIQREFVALHVFSLKYLIQTFTDYFTKYSFTYPLIFIFISIAF